MCEGVGRKDWTVFVKRDLGCGRPPKSPRLICEISVPFTVGLTRAKTTNDRSNLIR